MKSLGLYLMALLYIGAGINHFINPRFYLKIIPPYMPAHVFLNYISGIAEIVLGCLLMIEFTRPIAAWMITIMLIVFLTVHIYMLQQALHKEHYMITPTFAWIRLLFQPILIAWAFYYTGAFEKFR